MELDALQIREVLPHRYPFLLVDRVTDGEPGKWARAVKCVTQNEPFFAGHFPGKPIMPGVLIIEALAQTGGIAMYAEGTAHGKLAVLGGVKNAKFIKPVVPGDVLTLEASVTRSLGPVTVCEAEASVDGAVVAKAEITFVLTDI
ncbi:MAG: 3-hydroxyacyl-ACP dehydratase FabZ [Oscillospiraceae bacterium]|jgi:3-hydroxyacyl-[acyl-carrier-protein] dehydratase|nr:3-hydroxyacyl-ACP dehydratase FabZ [Oscillospiraceae bacterium]